MSNFWRSTNKTDGETRGRGDGETQRSINIHPCVTPVHHRISPSPRPVLEKPTSLTLKTTPAYHPVCSNTHINCSIALLL
jgi:hypothetical protein